MKHTTTVSANTLLDHLMVGLHRAGVYNRNDQEAPKAVLWPDEARWWEPTLPMVRRTASVLTLGEYDVEHLTGPAIWVRCALAGLIPEFPLDEDVTPIVYLPGYGRHQLRAIEDCPIELQPLAELRFRATWFSQENGSDWTPQALLSNQNQGLGLGVGMDQSTSDALRAVLHLLVDEPIARLRDAAPLTSTKLHALVENDLHGSMLRWMEDDTGFAAAGEFVSFCELSKTRLGFNPSSDSPIGAASRLASREGEWKAVWERFVDAPSNYSNISVLLRGADRSMTATNLFASLDETNPDVNDACEANLRAGLMALEGSTVAAARSQIEKLDAEHGVRRDWVWAKLAMSPLAEALQELARLAEFTETDFPDSSIKAATHAYADAGWRADDSLMRALANAERVEDVSAVLIAATALYRPWAERCAVAMTGLVVDAGVSRPIERPIETGTCRLFSDGLRLDIGHRLGAELTRRGLSVDLDVGIAAMPTVTATGKPAVMPIAHLLRGGNALGTAVAATGTAATAEVLRKLMRDNGNQVLNGPDVGDPNGRAWTEFGDIDELGHGRGWKLARAIDDEVRLLADRIAELLRAGWQKVEVVTDHGWVFEPDQLDKVDRDLPAFFTEVRKGRCARLKDGAPKDFPEVGWTWDSDVRIALAPGLKAFEKGKQYEHGGASPQECVVPRLIVTSGMGGAARLSISLVKWVGLRCRVSISNAGDGTTADLRLRPTDAESSIATKPAVFGSDGEAALLTSDDYEGCAAVVVIIASSGAVLAQQATVVGGGA